jgi:hypothetical protein
VEAESAYRRLAWERRGWAGKLRSRIRGRRRAEQMLWTWTWTWTGPSASPSTSVGYCSYATTAGSGASRSGVYARLAEKEKEPGTPRARTRAEGAVKVLSGQD